MTDLDYIKQEAAATTLSGVQMVKRYGKDTSKWPAGHWRNLLDRAAKLAAPPPPPTAMQVGANIYPGEEGQGAAFSQLARMDRGTPPPGLTLCGLIALDPTSPYALAPVVEVDNEPYFQGVVPATWAAKARDCAKAVRVKNPSAKILLPLLCQVNNADYNVAGTWRPWLSWLLDAVPDLLTYFDGGALHAYCGAGGAPFTGNQTIGAVDKVRAELTGYGTTMPFYVTELGWDTAKVSAADQANYLGDELAWLAARGDVAQAYVFSLLDGHDGSYGIVGKPAYQVAKGYV